MFTQKTIIASLITIGSVGLLALVCFAALQLVPVKQTNPPITNEPAWYSPQTHDLMARACFDCHSNETKWPWYSNIAPISLFISHEVQEGRGEINFSEWDPKQENESIEAVSEGEMPPPPYLLLHPEARLSNTETEALIAGLQATFGNTNSTD